MINLRVHTEFHFDFSDRGYGKLADVVARIKALGHTHAAITDSTTFGHVAWFKECTKAGLTPILGAEVRVPLEDEGNAKLTLLARNNDGLKELYHLTSLAASDEISESDIQKSSPDVIKLSGTYEVLPKFLTKRCQAGWYQDISPSTPKHLRTTRGFPLVATSENRFMTMNDRAAYSLFGGSIENYPQHLLSEREARAYLKGLPEEAFKVSDTIAKLCKVTLPSAVNMSIKGDLEKICRANIKNRVKKWDKVYESRLKLELRMIAEKKFESYFLIISDMVRYAKRNMVVGPARGSAAGSLVCFLADITDVDPLVHGLLFERFIDVTRADLPDIDLDFPDTKRDMVIAYLRSKYGEDNVAHIGTTLSLQPRSILKLVSKKLDIKMYEFQPLLDSMIERSSGDSRAAMCLLDTLEGMEAGKAILQRYPQVRVATAFEGHANATGTHAAGIIVCANPVREYCTVDSRSYITQIDKVDAEKINLLKIDILGLRTLSVLEHCVKNIPKKITLSEVPLEDKKAFKIINDGKWAGIFQFEGDAVQMLTRQIEVTRFSDIVALGALARPGPLNSGGATQWADRRMGREEVSHLHKLAEEFTAETYGIVVYQEQVMSIGRKIGKLDWDDVTELRKAMSKSKGEEFFNQYWTKFLKGALEHKMNEREARYVWDHMNTMGSWSFNKSHAVSYGLISYWCAYLKAHYPKQFAAATLRHAKDEEQTIKLLRELREEGIEYVAFDAKTSSINWEVIKGTLTGGFMNLKGCGETGATKYVQSRGKWTEKQKAKIAESEVLYSDIFPVKNLYGRMYTDPAGCGYKLVEKFWKAREIDAAKAAGTLPSTIFVLGKLVDKVPRSLNEYGFQVKRMQEGKPKELKHSFEYLNLVLEDDTGRIWITISAKAYEEVGKSIVHTGVVGKSYYVMKCKLNYINRLNGWWAKDITGESHPEGD